MGVWVSLVFKDPNNEICVEMIQPVKRSDLFVIAGIMWNIYNDNFINHLTPYHSKYCQESDYVTPVPKDLMC